MGVKLIAGLGNPGSRYQWTRHNAGFMALDRLSYLSGISLTRKSFSGLCGEGSWQGNRLILLKPQTYMNLSGRSIAEALRFYKISSADLIVIHDDLDIAYGRAKLKLGGGHGGHNGLRSILSELGNRDFVRVRIGVGRPNHAHVADYVLSQFDTEERIALLAVLDSVVDMLSLLLQEGLGKAMTLFNNRDLVLENNVT